MKKKYYRHVDETIYYTTLSNKMKVYLLYKPGFIEKDAYIVTHFGHFDSLRKIIVNHKKVNIPWGTAHFLEHRMFSLNDVDASELFASLGAQCNAYTTYEKTAFYFQCNDKFYECLDILLQMMDSFSSTQKQIDNEKKIILEEKHMYDEDPPSVINKYAYEQSYLNHPINHDIIGTDKTIMDMSKEVLEAVFNTYYDPSNLTLVVAGDINPDELESYLNKHLLSVKNPKKIHPFHIQNEPMEVRNEKGIYTMPSIHMPRLALLYKLKTYEDQQKKDKMYFCYNFILDYLFSGSGKLSEKWFKENKISSLIDYSVVSNIDLENIIFYNISDDLSKVSDSIKQVFQKGSSLNMSEDEFAELKKENMGAAICAYETVGGVCGGFVYDLFTSANDYFLEIDECQALTLDDINEAYQNICEAFTTEVILRGE